MLGMSSRFVRTTRREGSGIMRLHRYLSIPFYIFLVSSLLSFIPSLAKTGTELLADISAITKTHQVLKGTFIQTKHIQGFKKPVVSTGAFLIAEGLGVQWTTLTPFKSILVVTRDGLSIYRDDQLVQRLDTKQEPGLRAVNETLMSLLSGDLSGLSVKFNAIGKIEKDNSWSLSLTPNDSGLRSVLTRIELEGNSFVLQVRLFEATGDSSEIQFLNHVSTELSTSEKSIFTR